MKSEFAMMSKEIRLLARCESVIEKGMATFVEVGRALMEIRDGLLYRDQYDTFQDYCKERWGFGRQRAYQLICAAKANENVKHCLTNTHPANARQAAELAKLPDEQQAKAWEEVVVRTDGKPTAAAVAEVVDEYIKESAEDEPPASREPETWSCHHCGGEHPIGENPCYEAIQASFDFDDYLVRLENGIYSLLNECPTDLWSKAAPLLREIANRID
jgi:hypothetical protein